MSALRRLLFFVACLAFVPGYAVQGVASAEEEKASTEGDKKVRTDRYGDPLPPGAVMRLGTIRLRRPPCGAWLAFAPNSKILATIGFGDIRFWEVPTGKVLASLRDSMAGGGYLVFSPDGKTLASGGMCLDPSGKEQNAICLWDLATGRVSRRWIARHYKGLRFFTFSPDGKMLATAGGDDRTVRLWDVATGTETRTCEVPKREVYALAFAPDGGVVVSCSREDGNDTLLCSWETASGKLLWKAAGPAELSGVAFTADGKTLVAAGAAIGLYDAGTGQCVEMLKEKGIGPPALAPGGRTVALCEHGCIRLWDRKTGRDLHRFPIRDCDSYQLAFSPDGKTLAGADGWGGLVLWDTVAGRRLQPPQDGHQTPVLGLAYAPDGKTLASRGLDDTIRTWDMTTGRELGRIEIQSDRPFSFGGDLSRLGQCLAYSPNGKVLASASSQETFGLWDTGTGRSRAQLRGYRSDVVCLALSPDGRTVATGHTGNLIHLWDAAAGAELRRLRWREEQVEQQGDDDAFTDKRRLPFLGSTNNVEEVKGVFNLAFAPDGKTLAVACGDGLLRLLDVRTGAKQAEYPCPGHALVFSPDGYTLAVAERGRLHGTVFQPIIHLLDWHTGTELRKLTCPKEELHRLAIALSPDGKTLAAAGLSDATVRLCEVATGQEIVQLPGHLSGVLDLAFAPDGRTLASASEDTTVLIWDPLELARAQGLGGTWGAAKADALWADLAAADAAKAYRAVAALTAVPDRGVALLKERLRPASGQQGKTIRELIAELDSDDFAVREAASRELEGRGPEVLAAARQTLKASPSAEVRKRLEHVLDRMRAGTVDGEALRRDRAVQVLERIGSKEAEQVLQAVAQGAPAAPQTQDARAALGRLQRRTRER